DPGVIAAFGAGLFAFEAGAGIAVERPAFRTMIAGGRRTVERALALAAVEADQAAVRGRAPGDAILVDVAAADAVAFLRHVVDLRQAGCRIEAQEAGVAGEHADRVPDRAVGRIGHHRIGTGAGHDALVLGRIVRLVGLDELVALAVAVAVEDERRPALRLGGVAGFVEHL